MIIKGQKLRGREPQKNTLYTIQACDSPVQFKETHKENSATETVELIFRLCEKQYGVYGQEYVSPLLTAQGRKAVDILAICIDEEQQKYSRYLLDVKQKVEGVDELIHLLEQLQASCQYSDDIIHYLDGYEGRDCFGVITSLYSQEKFKKYIKNTEAKAKEVAQEQLKVPVLLRKKMELEFLSEKKKAAYVKNFLDRKLVISDKEYTVEVYLMEEKAEDEYAYKLEVKI